MLAGRRVVLGVTGGIAAYKAAYLARRLIERGASVRTVMTEAATRFLGAQTLGAITGTAPVLDLFDDANVSPHTDLARWAEGVVIAPATAATIARLSVGLSEDAVSATVLATRAPVVVAPAMHTEMWEHPATSKNIERLAAYGYHIVAPEAGVLAGGDEGVGRMAEAETIMTALGRALSEPILDGWRVLVTAGGTREPIDPVRYIGNRSSGKMGAAVAAAAARLGAEVTLVTTAAVAAGPNVESVPVESAAEMADAVWSRADSVDVVVMAAAVADFRPDGRAATKLRRADGPPEIALEPTPDVLAGVAEMTERPFLVGFAAETGSLDEAVAKVRRKGVDLLVANDVSKAGSGFGSDTNEVTLVLPDGTLEAWNLAPKSDVADRLWSTIAAMRAEAGTDR
jgi:phosphopantothenoylcysteine decarboxylase/phosphopantothenate--cysteine ligase